MNIVHIINFSYYRQQLNYANIIYNSEILHVISCKSLLYRGGVKDETRY